MICGVVVVIGLFGVGACAVATEVGQGVPATECPDWPDCAAASLPPSAAPSSAPSPAPAPPPAEPPAAPSTEPPAPPSTTGPPPSPTANPTPDTPPPAPPDADNVACLQVVLDANLANQQFVNLPVNAELAARVSVADQFDAAAAQIESRAATIADPAIQAKVADLAAEMHSLAGVLRSGSPIENSTLITKLTDLQTYCGLA